MFTRPTFSFAPRIPTLINTPVTALVGQHSGLMNFRGRNIKQNTYCPVISRRFATAIKDFGIIGGGAAGMAAAIHARYDGYSVAVFESRLSKGGSFANTPLIQNLPGFPIGISGASLSLGTIQQFEKLGGTYFSGTSIAKISKKPTYFLLHDKEAHSYEVKKIILASGVIYRKLELSGSDELEGKGIYYEVDDSILEEVNQSRPHICIYGAGNSAGQAALFYESVGAKVSIICRGSDLTSSMSEYLIQRITRLGIDILPHSTIIKLEENNRLSGVVIKNLKTNVETKIDSRHLFVMIGGTPTPLPQLDFGTFEVDSRGYVIVKGYDKNRMSFATNIPGIFAAGDITSVGAGRILIAQAQGVTAFVEASRADEI